MQKLPFVVAFDVDGTLEYGDPEGPIKLERVKQLKDEGFSVGIIGAREKVENLLPNLDFYSPGDPLKPEGLREVKERFNPIMGIYVADRASDREAALQTGFCFMYADDFR
jgi:hypothetical protein